jgi:hypothetical protein
LVLWGRVGSALKGHEVNLEREQAERLRKLGAVRFLDESGDAADKTARVVTAEATETTERAETSEATETAETAEKTPAAANAVVSIDTLTGISIDTPLVIQGGASLGTQPPEKPTVKRASRSKNARKTKSE